MPSRPRTCHANGWKVRAKQVILAQGAHERPLVFAGNDLPGVMLSGAVRTYINRYAVVPGQRAVIVTNNDDAYRTALALHDAGAHVIIADLRTTAKGPLITAATAAGIEILPGHAVINAVGNLRVGRVEIASVNADATAITGDIIYRDCDLVAMSGGFSPRSPAFAGPWQITWDDKKLCFKPSTTHEPSTNIGAGNGSFDLTAALREAVRAGHQAAGLTGHSQACSIPRQS